MKRSFPLKRFLVHFVLGFFLFLSQQIAAQSTTCPWVNAGPDQTICVPGCANLNATYLASSTTSTYTISTPPYAPDPFNAGTAVVVGDDQWSVVLPIGFTFCYYGTAYTQCLVGSNGEVSFKLGYASAYNTWPIGNAMANVNPADLQGCIQGPWQDLYPPAGGTIKYQVYGTAPCRRFVVSWNNISMYSCTGSKDFQQIVLYETTNIIDNFIQTKPPVCAWNGGYAIQCAQNFNGTVAAVVPGRNYPTTWTANNDAVRYTPAGVSNTAFSWLNPSNVVIGTNPAISVCPTTTSTYTAQVVYTNCDGTTVLVNDQVVVNVSTLTVTMNGPFNYCNPGSASLSATATGATSWSWAPATNLSCTTCSNPTATPTATTTYTCYVSNGVCTGTGTVTVTVHTSATLVMAHTNVLCNGVCTGTATVTPSGGNAPYTYVWSPSGGTNATATGLCAGNYTVTVTTAFGCTSTSTVTITQPTLLSSTQSQVNVLCNGSCTGTATVVASGGTSPYTYAWAPSGGTNATATGRCAGTYTCTITDANGCTDVSTFTITQPTALSSTQSQVNVLCNGSCTGTATVVGSGGTPAYTYAWAPSGGTNATATGRCAGTYTCTITDANGCTDVSTFTITQPTALTATQSQVNVLCNGSCTGTATVVASGGTSPYTYAWAPTGGTAATATGRCAGTYTCTITDANGCTITKIFTITQPIAALSSTQSQVNVLCNGSCTGTATVVASGGTSPYTYAWAPTGGTAATATGRCAGTYTCTITDANGCTDVSTFTITQPTALAATQSQVNVLCNGQCTGTATVVASGGTSPYTYVWAPTGGTAATATGRCAGTYTCTITDANGCTLQKIFTITQPALLAATQSQVNVLCNAACTGTATVVASGGTSPYTYAWAPTGGTAATATGRCAGTYTCTITDANGCTITKTFTITQPTAITATTSSTQSTCSSNNGTATVVASGGTSPYTYVWAPSGGTNATATGIGAGSYTVTITDANGCTHTATVVVTTAAGGTASISASTNVLCNGACTGSATVTMTGGTSPFTYLWAPSGGTAATATGRCAGSYTITVTDANGCIATATVTITQPTALAATQSQVNVLCNGQCTGTATVVASGGVSPYTYAWAPTGGTAATATGRCAGTYTCTITDANGCTLQKIFTITQPTVLAATQSQVNVLCNAACTGTATVVASGGTSPYTYVWAPSGGTGAAATGLCSGSYTCTITDANGCTVQKTFTITQPTAISLSTSFTQSTCSSSNGTATVVASGGTSPYTYAWAPSGGTNATATGLGAGSYTVTVTDANGCTRTATVVITTAAGGTASISTSVNVLCFGATTGSATVTMTGGTSPFTYVWAPSGGTNATATGLGAGSYTVTVTDANGCIATATVTITQPTALAATQSQVNILCNGVCNGSATIVASGGTSPYTYLWTPSGGTTATATGRCAGTYTCTITDANGCTLQKIFTITQPTVLAATQSQVNVLCNAACTATATVVASGGTSPYTYVWAPSGGTSATATGLCVGTYSCTITDANGCTVQKTFTITQPTAISLTISSTQSSCSVNNGTATVVASGGTSPYTYAWTPSGGTNAAATGLGAGSYTVTVTDANGCTRTATVVVTVATAGTAAISTSTNVLCFGGNNGSATVTMTGGTSPFTYVWSPSGGTSATGTGLTAGTYTVTVTDANGCVATATVTITQPTALAATQSQVNVLCNGACTGTATVVASGGTSPYTYAWTPSGGTAATATGRCAGTYTCTITDAHGCTLTQTFTITQPTVLAATQSQVNVLCNGACTATATVTPSGGTSPYTYVWAPSGGTAATATGLCVGSYTCTITDANGCTITKTFTITQPAAISLTTSSTQSSCSLNNGTATVVASGGTSPYTYVWAPSGGTNAAATGLGAGSYTVTVTDANGCTQTATVVVNTALAGTAAISASTNVLCFGGNNGSATVTMTGGTSPFTYAWVPSGGTNATATGLTAGTYTVTVTDANGCVATATVTITQPTALAATQSQVNVLCNGSCTGTATVVASGGTSPYTYAWAPSGGTAAIATGRCAGTYTCTITDANGCTLTQAFTITQPTALTATTTQVNVTCNALCNGSATVTAGGGTSPYTYAWAPSGGTAATATGLCAGSYTCTVTDANGCTRTATVTITQPTVLASTSSSINSNCGTPTGSAAVVASGGTSPYTYVWAPSGGTNATATGLVAGSYTCTITDANGCTLAVTVIVNNNAAGVSSISASVNVLCFGGNNGSATVTMTGGQSPFTYVWSPTGGTNATATGLIAGTYTVVVTDANGCSSSSTVTITEPTLLTASITGSTNILCNGGNNGNATVSASGGTSPYSYLWTPSGQTSTVAGGLAAGTYSCTVTDANGCTVVVTVTITQPPVLASSTTQVNVLCNGSCTGTGTVTTTGGVAPYTYNWTPSGGTSTTATGLCAGSYTVTSTDANNCTATSVVVITQPPALSGTIATVNANCGTPSGSAFATINGGVGPYTYLWNPTGQTTANATGLVPGSYTVTVTDVNGCTLTVTGIVNNNAAGVATIPTQVDVTCFGLCNGTATSLMTGGTAPYVYSWTTTPSQSTVTATGLCAGVYNVIITDANGCSSTASVTINQPTLVIVSVGPPTSVLCNGGNNGSVTASGAGGTGTITYLWTPSGQTTATATGLGSGTYTVVVTDANGCTAQTTVTITQPTVLTATDTHVDVLCNGNLTGSATVTASGGTAPYIYLWNPSGQTTNAATGLGAGNYQCITTDANGCTVANNIIITEPPALNLVLTFVQSTCSNPNGTATATVTGGNPAYIYLWSNGQTTAIATGLLAATYTVTITDANGCTISNNVTVPNAASPVASILSSVDVLCFGGNNGSAVSSVTGGTAPYTYLWTPTAQTTFNATGLIAGTYSVTVTDANGCTSTASVTITEPTLLTSAITASVDVLCNGNNTGSATVTPSGGTTPYAYLWNNAQTNATATGLLAGNYTVLVTDANGCTSQSTVTITEPTALTITNTGADVTCNGACNGSAVAVIGGGVAPYTYSWAPSAATTSSISGLCPGIYTLYATDANGCLINDTAIVQEPTLLTLTTTFLTAHCSQADGSATVTATGATPGYTYLWNNGQTTANATALAPNTYTVTVTDALGCTMTTTVVIPNAPGVVATNTNVTMATCNGVCDGTATAVGTGGVTPYTYSWSTVPFQTNATATGLCAGTYTCLITDASGCTDTTIVTITEPAQLVLAAIAPQTICIGQSANLSTSATGGTPAYTFNWNPGNLSGPNVTVSPTVTTTYTVTVTDVNNCTAINQLVTITVNPPLSVVAGGATAICIGRNTVITAAASGGNGGPYNYLWTPGNMTGTSVIVTPTVTTTYTITVTDNCTLLPATDTVTIVVNPLPVITFTTQPSPAEGCAPLCVTFHNTTPNSAACNWNFTVGTATNDCDPTFCFANAGSYDVTLAVIDNNGCANSLTMPAYVTVWPNPIADFTFGPQPTTMLNGLINFTDQSQGANQWSWDFGDQTGTDNVQNPSYTYLDSGNYVVTLWVTSIHGCRDSIQKTLRIDPDFTMYVPNAFTPGHSHGLNDVFMPVGVGLDMKNFKMWIFDRWGNLIWQTETWGKGWDGHANDGENIAQEDVYVWKIVVNDYLGNEHEYVGHVTLIK